MDLISMRQLNFFILVAVLQLQYLHGVKTSKEGKTDLIQGGNSTKYGNCSFHNYDECSHFIDDVDIGPNIGLTAKTFYLWTRIGAEVEKLDPTDLTSIKESSFEQRKTFIIVHGFMSYGLQSWIIVLKNKLLQRYSCNVISVDWPAGMEWVVMTYYLAKHRVPFVGQDTADLVSILIRLKGLSLKDVHIIGHSLGAHIAGYTGQTFKGLIGKITGLDPAGPGFRSVHTDSRLDESDALYVDIIHTNGCDNWDLWTDCYGISENIGHSDFWPNGGIHQPGCVHGYIGCNHLLAYDYYLESFDYTTNDTYFLARECEAWEMFIVGNCSCAARAQYMGFHVNMGLKGTFFLQTASVSPYAVKDPDCPPGLYYLVYVWGLPSILGFIIVLLIAAILSFCSRPHRNFNRWSLIDDEARHLVSKYI